MDPKTNEVIVGTQDQLSRKSFTIRDINWLIEDVPETLESTVKLRSAHSGSISTIKTINPSEAIVELYDGYPGITPGQACVMYDDTRVLGGGWITKVL